MYPRDDTIQMNSDGFNHWYVCFIALQTPPPNREFTKIIDDFSFTIHNSTHNFFNQIDNVWAIEPMMTFAKYFMLKEGLEVVRWWGIERKQLSQ